MEEFMALDPTPAEKTTHSKPITRIIFHGELSAALSEGIENLLEVPAEIIVLPGDFSSEADKQAYASADIIVSGWYNQTLPRPERVRLFQLPGAGYDGVNLAALP